MEGEGWWSGGTETPAMPPPLQRRAATASLASACTPQGAARLSRLSQASHWPMQPLAPAAIAAPQAKPRLPGRGRSAAPIAGYLRGVHRVRGAEAAGAPGVAAATGGGVADKSTPPPGLAAVQVRRQPTPATLAPTAALRLPSGPSAASSVRTSSTPPPTARLSTRTLVALG